MQLYRAAIFILVASSSFACGEKYKRDCSKVTGEVRYTDVQPVLETHCTRCHASDLVGNERDGAPASINYDTYADAKLHAKEGNAEVLHRSMPNDDPDAISDAEGCLLEVWIDQGMLQ